MDFRLKLVGPTGAGGPFRLQVWRRRDDVDHDEMTLLHAGEAPGFSPELGAWLVVTDGGRRLRLAHERDERRLWPTRAEAERAEAERLAAEAARTRGREPSAARQAPRARRRP